MQHALTVGEAKLRQMFERSESEIDLLLSHEDRNDIGNMNRLRKRFGRDLTSVQGVGWHVWSGKNWDQETGDQEAHKCARQVAVLIKGEARAAEAAGPFKDPTAGMVIETDAHFKKRIARLYEWANSSGFEYRLKAMLARAEKEVCRYRRELDANPWHFNCANGTIDLKPDGTWVFREHRREDLITRISPVIYDPKAECPEFIKWLTFILPDPADAEADGDHHAEGAVRSFLQRFFGYCLSGSTGEQVAPLFCGVGANGKSTLLNVMRGIFGTYAQTMPVETLLENDRKGGGDATPDIARLPGVRLALASEPEKKSRLSIAKLKQFTGGEPITARALYGGFFEFNPVFKPVLTFNDRPSIPAQDDGTWRRIALVMFNQKIPQEMRKDRFELELLKEAPGILNWLLQGYAQWRTKGLMVPDEVRAATEDYRSDNDPLGQFLTDCCLNSTEVTDQHCERSSHLFAAYEAWCDENATDPLTKRTFGFRLRDKGYGKRRSNGMVYDKIALTAVWADKAEAMISRRQSRSSFGRTKREESVDDVATRVGASGVGPKRET